MNTDGNDRDKHRSFLIKSSSRERFASLLAEYTGRLRVICESADRRLQLVRVLYPIGALIAICSLIAAAGFTVRLIPEKSPVSFSINDRLLNGLAILVIPNAITAGLFFSLLRVVPLKFGSRIQRAQIAAAVEMLLKTASQYNEHRITSPMLQLEYDLRVSEAEVVLAEYRRIFGSTYFKNSHDESR